MLRSAPDFGEDLELPWPRSGDELFVPADDRWMNAHIEGARGSAYVIGYKLAGDVLVDHVARHELDADTLVFPIVFSYRQYLELLLKDVLADARLYFNIDEAVPTGHPLLVLWRPLRKLLERRWPNGSPEELDAVGDGLRQFDAVDQGSFAFRYATDPAGKVSLPEGLSRINLRNLSEVIERIGVFLESCETALMEDRQTADW
jgi:hypothetical protein